MDAIGGKSGSMERGVPRRRRPRPVVSAGVEALLPRSEELAKGWLLALVEDAPLDEAAAILAGDVARDGPRICDAVVRALSDEADLRRIEQEGVLEPLASRAGELAGARSGEAAAHAVKVLEDVVWSRAAPRAGAERSRGASRCRGTAFAGVLAGPAPRCSAGATRASRPQPGRGGRRRSAWRGRSPGRVIGPNVARQGG